MIFVSSLVSWSGVITPASSKSIKSRCLRLTMLFLAIFSLSVECPMTNTAGAAHSLQEHDKQPAEVLELNCCVVVSVEPDLDVEDRF